MNFSLSVLWRLNLKKQTRKTFIFLKKIFNPFFNCHSFKSHHGKIILTSLFVQKQITCNLVGFDLLVIDDYLLLVTFVNSIFIRIKNLAVYFMTENCSFFVMRLPWLNTNGPLSFRILDSSSLNVISRIQCILSTWDRKSVV